MFPSSKVINLAREQARLSTHRFRLGAVIYKRNKIMGFGYNDHIKTHPLSPHPYGTKHAEFCALLDAVGRFGQSSVYNNSIYVQRLKAHGLPGIAKPCQFCDKMLRLAGITDIHWSTDTYGF